MLVGVAAKVTGSRSIGTLALSSQFEGWLRGYL